MSLTQATKPALQSSFQGNINPGTATGSVSYNANGLYGQSLIITNPSTFGAYAVNYVSYTLDYIIPLTTSIWIKFPTVSASYVQYFLNFSGGPGGIAYALYLETNNSFTLRAQSATGGYGSPAYVNTTPSTVVSGKWYHVVTVIDGSYMSIYINGTLAGINNTFIGSGLNNPYLGGFKDSNPNRFIINAELADFRVYNTALSEIQIQALYANGGAPSVPASTTMVASAPVVRDTSPNPLTLSTYGSATSNTNSPFGGSELSIENLTYYIPSTVSKTNFSFWGSNSFIEFWMYLSGTNSGNPRIIERGNYPASEYSVYMNASSGGYYLKFSYGDTGGAVFPFQFQFVPGTWNHYSFSYNPTINTWYGSINGTVVSHTPTLHLPSYNSGSTVALYPSGSGYVIDISNLRVVTGATTLPYISNFTVPTAPLSNYPTGTTALLLRAVGPIRLTGTPLISQLSVAPVAAFSLRAVNGVTAKAVRVRRAPDNATQDFYADRLGNLLTAPVTGTDLATWLGGATGYVATWYDQSGAGNHVTQPAAANQPTITPGVINFNGSNQWFSNASPSGGCLAACVGTGTKYTYSTTWQKPPSVPFGRVLEHNAQNGGNNNASSLLAFEGTCNFSGQNNDTYVCSYTVGSQTSVVMRVDNTTTNNIRTRCNGVDFTSASGGGAANLVLNNYWFNVGRKYTGGEYFNGTMKNIFVFSTAISDADTTILDTWQRAL
jgi:hypothetical protein